MGLTVMVVVQPYERHETRGLYALPLIPARDVGQGKLIAKTLNCAGAVVYGRAGDPDLGEWGDAEILLVVGQVPGKQEVAA